MNLKVKKILSKSLIFCFSTLFVSLALSLLAGEFIVKHTSPQQTYTIARGQGIHIFAEGSAIPFTLQKNIKKFHHIGYTHEFDHYINTNSYGLRGKEVSLKKPQGTYRILFLGDSMTFGWGVEDDQTYPALVEKFLDKNNTGDKIKHFETINAGFTNGLTIDSFYLYLTTIGAKFEPDLVIVNFFPYNDITDLADMTWEKTDQDGLPTKIYSPNYKIEDGYMVSRAKTNWKFAIPILRDSHLAILLFNAMDKGSPTLVGNIKSLLHVQDIKRDYTNEAKADCLAAMNDVNCPKVLWQNVAKVEMIFAGIKNLSSKNNSEFLITLMPDPTQALPISKSSTPTKSLSEIQPQTFFKDKFAKGNIKVLDLLPAFLQTNAEGFYFKNDGHLTKFGNRFVALEILNKLQTTYPEIFPKIVNKDIE